MAHQDKKKKMILFRFHLPLQQALEHNSFLSSEKKIEQGNVEYAFKHVDQVIEGTYDHQQPGRGGSL